MIRKRRNRKNLIIISLILIIILLSTIRIGNTYARYKNLASGTPEVDIALWVVDDTFASKSIIINNLYPSDTPFEYTFSVSNFVGTKKADTDMEYTIKLKATTNLPLSYEIYKSDENGQNAVKCEINETLTTDGDGTIYKEIVLDMEENHLYIPYREPKTDMFTIKVTFPKEEYEDNYEFADLIEDIRLELVAQQVIDNK